MTSLSVFPKDPADPKEPVAKTAAFNFACSTAYKNKLMMLKGLCFAYPKGGTMKIKKPSIIIGALLFCGETGIRTPEGLASLTVFKTAAFNHSAISPVVEFTKSRLAGKSSFRATNIGIVSYLTKYNKMAYSFRLALKGIFSFQCPP